MAHFLFRRLLLTIPVLLGVATLVFSLIHLVPGDPVQAMLGESASPQDVARAARAGSGSIGRCYVQYGAFLKGVARGDLGTSLRTNQPVAAAIAERMPATFELALAAMVVAVADRDPARHHRRGPRRHRASTHAATTLALLGISMPNFWLGPLLAIVFSVDARLAAGVGPRHARRISCCRRSRSARRWRRCWRG